MIRGVLLFSALMLLVGCTRPAAPQGRSFQTTPQASEALRVGVLPFWQGEKVGRSAQQITDNFAASLRTLGRHEVINVTPERRRILLPDDALATNRITTDALVRLREALQVDAVVIGRIEQFDSFDPPVIGMTAHLVSCLDGSVLWSATAHLDGGRQDVQDDLEWWSDHQNGAGNRSIAGWRLALSSPATFARYATDRLVETIPYPEGEAK